MGSFNSSWLNRFGSVVFSSETYWSSAERRMSSDEKPFSHSICSKNASRFSGGRGTGKLSSWGIDLNAEFRFWYKILCLFFAQKPVTLTQQKYQSSTWFYGFRHIIGIAKDIAVFRLFNQWRNMFEYDVHITWGAQPFSWSSNVQPIYNWYNVSSSSVIACCWTSVVNEPYMLDSVLGWLIPCRDKMDLSY